MSESYQPLLFMENSKKFSVPIVIGVVTFSSLFFSGNIRQKSIHNGLMSLIEACATSDRIYTRAKKNGFESEPCRRLNGELEEMPEKARKKYSKLFIEERYAHDVELCVEKLKGTLKDPDSLKLYGDITNQWVGIIKYSAANSYGGRVKDTYYCDYDI